MKTILATWTSKWLELRPVLTSLQMDIKVAGITPQIMEKALDQAKEARLHILGEMAKSLSAPSEFSKYAPKIES